MFTGIVQSVGVLQSITRQGKGAHVVVATKPGFLSEVQLGDSIATNGVCLTATALRDTAYEADLSFESFNLTTFAHYTAGTKVNLELACTPVTRLGGHIMQGHVDGVGTVLERYRVDEALNIWVQAPKSLARYIAMKGSIAVDGISLTVNEVRDCDFRLTLIPLRALDGGRGRDPECRAFRCRRGARRACNLSLLARKWLFLGLKAHFCYTSGAKCGGSGGSLRALAGSP